MRFVCDNCKSKYSISDERVRGKVLKIRCKRCGHIIEVRDPAHSAFTAPTVQQSAQAFFAPQPAPPEERGFPEESTQISSPGLLDELKRTAANLALQPTTDAVLSEWYVAIDENPIGPVTKEQIRGHFAAGKVDSESLAWREGFGEWRPLRECADLKDILQGSRAFGAVAAPPKGASPKKKQADKLAEVIPLRPQDRNRRTDLTPPPRRDSSQSGFKVPPPSPEYAGRVAVPLRGRDVGRLGTRPQTGPSAVASGSGLAALPVAQPEMPLPPPPTPEQPPAPPGAPTPRQMPKPPMTPGARSLPQPPMTPGAQRLPQPPMTPGAHHIPAAPPMTPADQQLPPVPGASPSPSPAASPSPPAASPEASLEDLVGAVPPSFSDAGEVQSTGAFAAVLDEEVPTEVAPPPPPPSTDIAAPSPSASVAPTPSMVPEIKAATAGRRRALMVLLVIGAMFFGIVGAVIILRLLDDPQIPVANNDPTPPAPPIVPDPDNGATKAGMSAIQNLGSQDTEGDPEAAPPDAPSGDTKTVPAGLRPVGPGAKTPVLPEKDTMSEEDRRLMEAMGQKGTGPVVGGTKSNDPTSSAATRPRGQSLSEGQVRSTVGKNMGSVQRCYEREMRGARDQRDLRVNVRIRVAPSGVVRSASVSGPVRGTALGRCIEQSVRRWRFPAATADTEVVTPFVLTPRR